MTSFDRVARTAIVVLVASVASPAYPTEDQDWFDQDGVDLRQVIADYAAKVPHWGQLEVFVYRGTRGLIALSEEDLESVGFEQGWAGCVGMKTTLILSLEDQASSDQLELCVVEKLWGRELVWYYPVVSQNGQSQILAVGSYELITFEIDSDGSVLFLGHDIGLGGVRAIARYAGRDDDEIRCLVIFGPDTDSELTQRVVEEVLAGSADATVIARVRSNAILEGRKIGQNKPVEVTPDGAPHL